MSIIKKAAEVIDQWTEEGYELNSAVGSPHAIAERLAEAGLLAPDLPEPDGCPPDIHKPGWHLDISFDAEYAAAFAGGVWVTGTTGWGIKYSPEKARAAAYKLLAAANHAEAVENED